MNIRRLSTSLRFALHGLRFCWHTQPNFRLELVCAGLAIALALWLKVDLVPILLCCSSVLTLELANTAVEQLVDLISPDEHPLAKYAKDVAAGAVLVGAFFALFVGIVSLLPALINRLFSTSQPT